jgi:hypothetical protein
MPWGLSTGKRVIGRRRALLEILECREVRLIV